MLSDEQAEYGHTDCHNWQSQPTGILYIHVMSHHMLDDQLDSTIATLLVTVLCWCRRAYEEWVFSSTKAINKARSRSSVSAAQEPKRSKTAWDALLEEMEWLAKDFMRSVTQQSLPTSRSQCAGNEVECWSGSGQQSARP